MQEQKANLDQQFDVRSMRQQVDRLRARAERSKIRSAKVFETRLRSIEDQLDLFRLDLGRQKKSKPGTGTQLRTSLARSWRKIKESMQLASEHLH